MFFEPLEARWLLAGVAADTELDAAIVRVAPLIPEPLYERGTSAGFIGAHPDVLYAPGSAPAAAGSVQRFEFAEDDRWTETASDGSGLRQGDPTTLTWSFLPDGVSVSSGVGEPVSNSSLISFLGEIYGVSTKNSDLTDEPWFSLFESTFQRWGAVSGLTYLYEPNDDGAPFVSTSGQVDVRGDVRIAAHPIDGQTGSNTLAYNYFPNSGDMVLDTDNSNLFEDQTNNSLALRNVLGHEHGHGLGLGHVCPVVGGVDGRLMEPFINLGFDGPQFDDILAVQRGYGDAFEKAGGNDTAGVATNLGVLTPGVAIVRGVDADDNRVLPTETEFFSIDDDSDIDFFAFTLNTAQYVDLTLTPMGPTYLTGGQNSDGSCTAGTSFDASSQSDLALQLIDSDGVSVLQTASATGLGASEVLADVLLKNGTYFAMVTGANDAAQMYELSVVGTQAATVDITATDSETRVSEAGLTDTYTIGLGIAPAGAVQFSVAADSQTEVSSDGVNFSSTLSLTLDSTVTQTITVRAVDDALTEGLHSGTITHSITATADTANYPTSSRLDNAEVTILDNELSSFKRLAPLGGLMFSSDNNLGTLADNSASADFTFFVEGGQTISALLEPLAAVEVSVQVLGVSAKLTSAADGSSVALPPQAIASDSIVTMRVTGAGATDFNLDVFRNAALEDQLGDTEGDNELDISDSYLQFGSGRFGVLGSADAKVIIGGELVGVDFDEDFFNLTSPNNWTRFTAATNDSTINDLPDESSATTKIDLRIQNTDVTTNRANVAPTAATVPTHTQSLLPLDGSWVLQKSASWTFTWSDLDPNFDYEYYLFGLGTTNDDRNDVTVTGATAESFSQAYSDGMLIINSETGSSSRTLASYARTIAADDSGKIVIQVDWVAGNAGLGGIAIRKVGGDGSPQFVQTNDPSAFIDISSTGTALNLGDDGNATINTTVGNSIFPAGSVSIGNNGAIIAGAEKAVPFSPAELPTNAFGNALLPFWDDIDSDTGNVFWEERRVSGNNTLIVQWEDRPHFSNVGSATFQLQLFETGPILARYVYADVDFGDSNHDFGASATIGYQANVASAVQFSRNLAALADGDVLEFAIPVKPDLDEYEVDLTGRVGQPVDFLLSGLGDTDFAAQTLELLDADGTTVLATGKPEPVQGSAAVTNYDVGILGFIVPADGVYSLRLTSNVPGDYGIVITDSILFDTEPNDALSDPLRSLTNAGSGLGYLSAMGTLDQDDFYIIDVQINQALTVYTRTPFDSASTNPVNSLDPELQIIHPDGITVVATDKDSVDGKNAALSFIAPETGAYRIRVRATAGGGEYLLKVTETARLSVEDVAAVEGGGLLFTVTLDRAVLNPFDVNIGFSDVSARGGSLPLMNPVDYHNSAVSLSFSGTAGETRQFTVDTLDDNLLEGGETFVVTLAANSNIVLDSDIAIGTITDNDDAEVTVADVTTMEGGGLLFTVTLDHAVQVAF
ncbi:MAG: matrixin family metalloprotease, partial [Planctomycetota bacterium]|nr:matrixin family metalloprotease [Planctomycetota bacterium]